MCRVCFFSLCLEAGSQALINSSKKGDRSIWINRSVTFFCHLFLLNPIPDQVSDFLFMRRFKNIFITQTKAFHSEDPL